MNALAIALIVVGAIVVLGIVAGVAFDWGYHRGWCDASAAERETSGVGWPE